MSAMTDAAAGSTGFEDKSDSDSGRSPLLLQMRSDRRLGHEWDDWDGRPLPEGGVFQAGPSLYFGVMSGAALFAASLAGLIVWMVEPRLVTLHPALPGALFGLTLAALLASSSWLALLAASLGLDRALLPPALAERGPLPWSMRFAERAGATAGLSRDRIGSSALRVFNRIAVLRAGAHRPEELLLLLPRCLSRDSMRAAIDLSSRYGVPAFVASRGRHARQMIGERRPSAVLAVACERDLVSGIADVGRRLPVLGATIGMPAGPCRDTELDIAVLERQLLAMLEDGAGKRAMKPERRLSD